MRKKDKRTLIKKKTKTKNSVLLEENKKIRKNTKSSINEEINNKNSVNEEINTNKTNDKTWLNKKVFSMLITLFLLSQVIGIIVANNLTNLGIRSSPITGDINNPLEAIYLITMILLMTVIILVIIKYKKQRKILWLLEGLAIFSTSIIVFSSFLPTNDLLVLIITTIILATRHLNKKSILFRNFVSIIAIAGAGSLIGISLGVMVVIIFIVLLSIYDLIAVFKTKHMVELGKSVVKQNLAFTVAMPTKEHCFELGNGDLIIPLILASSIIANGFFNNNFLVAILCLIGSLIGLIFSIYIVAKKKIPLPALPPQTVIMVIIVGASILIGL